MAAYAQTEEIGTSAETVTGPTEPDRYVRIHNLDSTNPVWIAVRPGITAAAEADDCVIIPAGASYYARWMPSYSLIAISAACKVVFEGGQGRG